MEVLREGAPSLFQEITRNWVLLTRNWERPQLWHDLGPGNDSKCWAFSKAQGKRCPSSSRPD